MKKSAQSKGDAAGRNAKGQFQNGNPTQWAKGQSGNPGGKRNPVTALCTEWGIDNNEEMIAKIGEMALAGERWACEFMAGYIQGKPEQTRRIIEESQGPITLINE